MCGRLASDLPPEMLARIFQTLNRLPNLGPSWNVAPSQEALAVRRHPGTGARHLDVLKWGLLPYRTRHPAKAKRPINARAETVPSSPMFKDAFARRRAIVPARCFFEWQTLSNGKQPFAVARADGAPLAFAGLWESFKWPDGSILRTFAIITTEANATMRPIHDRMPVVLEPADWPLWLGEEQGDAAELLRPADDAILQLWPVSTRVNAHKNNDLALLDHRVEEANGGGPNPA